MPQSPTISEGADVKAPLASSAGEIYKGDPFAGTIFRLERDGGAQKEHLLATVKPDEAITLSEARKEIDGFHGKIVIRSADSSGDEQEIRIAAGDPPSSEPETQDSVLDDVSQIHSERKLHSKIQELRSRIQMKNDELDRLREEKTNAYPRLQSEVESLEAERDRLEKKIEDQKEKIFDLKLELAQEKTADRTALERGMEAVAENLGPVVAQLADVDVASGDEGQSTGQTDPDKALTPRGDGAVTDRGAGDKEPRPSTQGTQPEAPAQENPSADTQPSTGPQTSGEDGTASQKTGDPQTEAPQVEIQASGATDLQDIDPADIDKGYVKREAVLTVIEALKGEMRPEVVADTILHTHRFHKEVAENHDDPSLMFSPDDWKDVAAQAIDEALHRGFDESDVAATLKPIAEQMVADNDRLRMIADQAPRQSAKLLVARYDLDLQEEAMNFLVDALTETIKKI